MDQSVTDIDVDGESVAYIVDCRSDAFKDLNLIYVSVIPRYGKSVVE